MTYMIPSFQLQNFNTKGYVLAHKILSPDVLLMLTDCTHSLERIADKNLNVMKYYERSLFDEMPLLNRAEKFIEYYPELNYLLKLGEIYQLAKSILGQRVSLLKEKINFKFPGANGFNIHQDAPAFTRFIKDEMLVMMVAIDEMNEKNGCLEVANNFFSKEIIPHVSGVAKIPGAVNIEWHKIIMSPGDVLFFSSYLLHKSAPNLSDRCRRCFFFTYHKSEYGDLRDEYFTFKRNHFPPAGQRNQNHDYQSWIGTLSNKLL